MDPASKRKLASLLREKRTAALGTLRDGAPFVSMVPFAVSEDLQSFYIHVSRLAHHTHDIVEDRRVGLMIAEHDADGVDPQTLARVCIQGEASEIAREDAAYADAKAYYLQRFPHAAFVFTLGDFSMFRILPQRARFIAGLGRIYNLAGRRLEEVAEERTGNA